MSLLDLSLVTTTLLRLLKARVDPLWAELFPPAPPPPTITYSGVSSDKLTADQALGMFLYSVNEDNHFKNQPPIYQDRPPVRFTPMGLQLQYQLVSHANDLGDVDGAILRSQRLFGLALKTLHDFPSLDRNTQIGGTLIFPPALQGTDNVIRINLRNMPPNEVTNFWTAGNQFVRLAAYYEISATLLEPDRPQLHGQRVLRYGVQVFVNGAPRLDASRSTVTFRIPGEATDRTAEAQPAEAASGENLSFDGTDLNGDSTTLLIRKTGWDEPQEVGTDWGVVAGPTSILAQVQDAAGSKDVVPGVYSTSARVTRYRIMPDGTTRAFAQESNQVPFTVSPTITNPTNNAVAVAVGPQQIVTVDGGVFQHADVTPDSVRVFVGPEPVLLEPTAALMPGHFEIVNPTQLRFRFPLAGVTSGATLPLRVIVNGAENSPRWVLVP
jgi:Pvc16 N-terminal domain